MLRLVYTERSIQKIGGKGLPIGIRFYVVYSCNIHCVLSLENKIPLSFSFSNSVRL